ncbi:MAG TPA: cytochrome c biogenesis protein ResB [Dehalococcoidia bacterium]|nr:cytochrome c biogenesis protein ResB [Dehalococcoidia bacterium]
MPADKTPVQERVAQQVLEQAPQFDPLAALWRFFTNTKVAVIIIFLTLIAAFIGALFIQAPGWALESPLSYASWLDRARARYGGLTDFFSAVGLFNAYNSIWFRGLCSLLIINTIACTVNRFPGIWRSVFRSKLVMGDNFYQSSTNRASVPGPLPVDKVVQALRKERYQVSQTQEGNATYLYADRHGWAKLGTILTHLSIVLFLVGAITGALFGFSDDEVIIGEGSSYTMGRGYNFQVQLNDFAEEWYLEGMPKDYRSDLSVLEGGREVERKTIRVNDPLVYKDIKFSQSFYGVAPAMVIKDGQGTVLFSDIMPLNPANNRPEYEVGWVRLPPNATVLVGRPKKVFGAAAGRLELEVYAGNTVRDRGLLEIGKPIKSGDLEINFQGDKEFTGLRMSRDPGTGIIWIASSLMLIGMCSSFYFPRRRLWARIRPQGVDLAAFADRSVAIGQELDSLARALSPDAYRPRKTKRKS